MFIAIAVLSPVKFKLRPFQTTLYPTLHCFHSTCVISSSNSEIFQRFPQKEHACTLKVLQFLPTPKLHKEVENVAHEHVNTLRFTFSNL